MPFCWCCRCLAAFLLFAYFSCQALPHQRLLAETELVDHESIANIFGTSNHPKQMREGDNQVGTSIGVNLGTVQKEGGEKVASDIRHIPIFFPMSIQRRGKRFPFSPGPSATFAAALALHDFNRNISAVIPSVGHERDSCPDLELTTSIFDTRMSPRIGSEITSEILRLNPRRGNTKEEELGPYPTAMIGAGLSSVSAAMSILAGIKSVPIISGLASSDDLENKGIYPTFGRVVPSDVVDAEATVLFFSEVMNVNYFGLLYRRDSFGENYAKAIKQAAANMDPPMVVALSPYTPNQPNTENEIKQALRFLQNTGFRYFFASIFSQEYVSVMEEASRLKITGPGYYWMLGEAMSTLSSTILRPDSPIINATFGTALISSASPSVMNKSKSRFQEFSWHRGNASRSDEIVGYYKSLLQENFTSLFPKMSKSLTIGEFPAFLYEAGMAVAFSACRSYKVHGPRFSGEQMFNSFLDLSFQGVLGDISIDNKTGSRDHRTVTFSMSTILPVKMSDGNVTFNISATHIYDDADWRPLGVKVLFSDNTTNAPSPLPPLNRKTILIDNWAQNLGLSFSVIILFLSLFFSVWTMIYRKTKVVKASQPLFLHMLCSGTFVVGLAIIPMMFQYPNNQSVLDASCMATPWLVSGGFVIAFSAVLSKLRRVNALFNAQSHRRLVVGMRDVMLPFTILFVFNVVVLVSWTAIDPLTYVMHFTDATDAFGRPIETYGRCADYKFNANHVTFGIIWAGIILFVIVLANAEAFKARGISTEYSESQYIAISMVLTLQSILIGLPLLFVVDALPTFWYLVKTSILFIVCISMLLPIFVPKMVYLRKWRGERLRRESRKSQRIQKWAEMKARIEGSSVALSDTATRYATNQIVSSEPAENK